MNDSSHESIERLAAAKAEEIRRSQLTEAARRAEEERKRIDVELREAALRKEIAARIRELAGETAGFLAAHGLTPTSVGRWLDESAEESRRPLWLLRLGLVRPSRPRLREIEIWIIEKTAKMTYHPEDSFVSGYHLLGLDAEGGLWEGEGFVRPVTEEELHIHLDLQRPLEEQPSLASWRNRLVDFAAKELVRGGIRQ